MAQALKLKRPSPFAFPGGQPGFNPSHVAAGVTGFSGIALGANFVSLVPSAKSGTIVGGPSAALLGGIGPGVTLNVSGVTDAVRFSGFPAIAATNITLAALIVWDGSAGNGYLVSDSTSGAGSALLCSSGGLWYVRYGGTSFGSSLVVPANVPCLVIGSSDNSTKTNILYVRLDTGQVFTDTAVGSAAPSCNGTYAVGNSPGTGDSFHGTIAAAMISTKFLSIPQMLQWAQDPWSFWYPGKFDMISAIKAAAAAASAAVFRKTLSYVGTRIGSRQNQVS